LTHQIRRQTNPPKAYRGSAASRKLCQFLYREQVGACADISAWEWREGLCHLTGDIHWS